MSIKVRIGLNRKVGEPNYSSRGASIELEAEVDNSIATNPNQFQQQVRGLYEMARQSINTELSGSADSGPALPNPANFPAVHHSLPADRRDAKNGSGTAATNRSNIPAITNSQVRAIYALCKQRQINPGQCVQQEFGKSKVEDLNIRQASQLIDQLKDQFSLAGS
ncbi:MAG: hypothetical protein KF752_09475 [Pirellulaceae bacterium]|nr:hypothetical protein [Pirellulaceae bacterium]